MEAMAIREAIWLALQIENFRVIVKSHTQVAINAIRGTLAPRLIRNLVEDIRFGLDVLIISYFVLVIEPQIG